MKVFSIFLNDYFRITAQEEEQTSYRPTLQDKRQKLDSGEGTDVESNHLPFHPLPHN